LEIQGVIAAGYASKIQMEQRQLYRDSSRNNGRHYAIIWKTTQLLEPTVLKNFDIRLFYNLEFDFWVEIFVTDHFGSS
jgi:hypothetical protein